jgi:hypothetical protein
MARFRRRRRTRPRPRSGDRRAGRTAARRRAPYATGGNAIYYGLGVTEHAQGSTTVMGIANLAMATGNIGREGVGVNRCAARTTCRARATWARSRTSCRATAMSDSTVRQFEGLGRGDHPEPGLRIPNMFEAALAGSFKGLYCQGEDIVQSDPNTQHVAAALSAMECIVVQDIFLNETAKYAHVFLPGSSFLEKDGTFTNAERRISRVRKVMPPLAGYADWEVTILLSNALGYPMHYTIRPRSWTRSRLTPTSRASATRSSTLGSIQWPCNEAPGGHADHARGRLRARQGPLHHHAVRADRREGQPRYPLILTTGRILSQYNVGAQTRRTPTCSGTTRTASRSIRTTPRNAASRTATGSASEPRRRDGAARDRQRAHAAGRGLHDLPLPRVGRQRDHHRQLRLGHQLPGVQGDGRAGDAGGAAVHWQRNYHAFNEEQLASCARPANPHRRDEPGSTAMKRDMPDENGLGEAWILPGAAHACGHALAAGHRLRRDRSSGRGSAGGVRVQRHLPRGDAGHAGGPGGFRDASA